LIFLGLPGLTFLFLKFAGKNQFQVPILYKDGITNMPSDCFTTSANKKPYSLSRQNLDELKISQEVNVIVFPDGKLNTKEVLSGISEEFGSSRVGVIDVLELTQDSVLLNDWKKCVLFIKPPFQSVLVDGLGQVRSYYDLKSREEIDRLRVEIQITIE